MSRSSEERSVGRGDEQPDRRARERADDLGLQRAHLRVGLVGAVFTAIGAIAGTLGALVALGVLHAPDGGTASEAGALGTSTSTRPAPRSTRWPSEVPAALRDNAEAARAYERERIQRARDLARAQEQLRRFVRTRVGQPVPCDPVPSVSRAAVAALRCEVDGMRISYVRLTGRSATDDYFGARLRATVSSTWASAHHVCHAWWTYWFDETHRRIGYVASRRRGDEALMVWSFDRHDVVAMASVPVRAGAKLCDVWTAFA